MSQKQRKGARTLKDIPPEVLEQLNKGQTKTVNLMEWLAIDQIALLKHILKENRRETYADSVLLEVRALKKQSVNTLNETIGKGLLKQIKYHKDEEFSNVLSRHPSDMVRCWACYLVSKNPALTFSEKLQKIRFLAANGHFGVREVSWLSLRTELIGNLAEGIEILSEWAVSEDENIRRFASESTRPRGVWCAHIEALKRSPEMALGILEPLKSDPSRYVQDSVGNWLNDAAKTQPQFVEALCQKWQKESESKATAYILKKAQRSINK